MSSSKTSQAGFSLIELLVAIFFIGVVLTAIAVAMTGVARSIWETKSRSYATNLAQNCIEEFNFANQSLPWGDFYNFTDEQLNQICLQPSGLCCATGEDSCSPSTVCPTAAQAPQHQINNEQTGLPFTAKVIERQYWDEPTQTLYKFHIEWHIGHRTYQEQLIAFGQTSGSGREVERETTVVTIDVDWQRFSASENANNHYSISRQYLEVN